MVSGYPIVNIPARHGGEAKDCNFVAEQFKQYAFIFRQQRKQSIYCISCVRVRGCTTERAFTHTEMPIHRIQNKFAQVQ